LLYVHYKPALMDNPTNERPQNNPFDDETWALLPNYFAQLPEPVRLHVWADPQASLGEREAVRLAIALEEGFAGISTAVFPRRINYPYYPVIGVFGLEDGEPVDYGVRIIGLPAGLQMTSLIAAIQAVAFRGVTLEVGTRIRLKGLQQEARLELLSTADDEGGTVMAKTVFGLAVANVHIRAFLIMADVFPEVSTRYSTREFPHLIINGKVHAGGILSEEDVLRQIATAVAQN
jgi:alkyl hydroperoxide reductase subunit AhpF